MARYSVSGGGAGFPTSRLSTSGDSSEEKFDTYFVHTQTIGGTWERKWVYDPHGGGGHPHGGAGASGPPPVQYTYLLVNFDENVVDKTVIASLSGTTQQAHKIDYYTDSSSGGWGLSGYFYTTQAGVTTKKKTVTDSDDECFKSAFVEAGKQAGDYNAALDTSASFNGQFFSDVIMKAVEQCPRFNTSLVDI